MAEPWYSVPGIPPEESNGLTAFMPHMNRLAGGGAQQYKYELHGRPGTQATAAPTGNTQMSPDVGDKAQAGTARSSDAPDVWFPQIYYQRVAVEAPGAGMPIERIDLAPTGTRDVLPIPAVNVALQLRSRQAMSPPTGVVQRVRQLPWYPRLYQAPGA
jgi:hypothetical protein